MVGTLYDCLSTILTLRVWDLEFTADSQYVISASSDSVARLWSLKTGELKREYQAHQKPLTSLAFRDLNGVQNSVSSD